MRDALPQTLANLAVVTDMLKRYHKGLEQALVILPQGATIAQAGHDLRRRGPAALRPVDQPAATVSDRLPAGVGVAFARRHHAWRRCRRAPTARSRRTTRATSFAARATIRARTCRASVRRRRRSAAATSRTFRWAPTRGTATRIRSSPARPPARALRSAGQARLRGSGTDDQQRDEPAACRPVAGNAAARSATRLPRLARARSAAVASSPTRASTLRHQVRRRSTARPAVRSLDPTGSSTPSTTQATQETTDGRRCWHQPAEPHRTTDNRSNRKTPDAPDDRSRQQRTTPSEDAEPTDSGEQDAVTRRPSIWAVAGSSRSARCWSLLTAGVGVGGYLALRVTRPERGDRPRRRRSPWRGPRNASTATQAPDTAAMTASQTKIIECADRRLRRAGQPVRRACWSRPTRRPTSPCRCPTCGPPSERHNDDDSVDVLVAVRVKVTNSQAANQEQGYRLRVKMAPADGTYKVARLDQVTS